jgi:signal transduction histidine kinase
MSPPLMPHAVCWRQDQRLIWTMVVTNAITFLSYSTICLTLFYLARKTRQAVARDWAFFAVGFALFIVACGSTHLMEVVTTWIPVFWVDAWTNIVTAALSGYVAIQLIRRAPDLGFGINDYAARLVNSEIEKARVEESLLSARKLEEWNQMSAVVTHEINNPLAAIQNLLYLIQETPDISPSVAAMAQQSTEEVRRVGTLTRSTLDFFRQDRDPEQVDLLTSAESVRFLLNPVIRQRGIEFLIQSTGDCKVYAFPMETRQVLLNLVRNACEATTHRGGQVRITMQGKADSVNIQVADEGAGISPSIIPSLFQFGVSTKGDHGNGMGLWAVRKIISRHGGTIEVESKLGGGTRFTIIWPRQFPARITRPNNVVAIARGR